MGEIKNDLKRKDTYEIPIAALREVLINAVVHRDYSILGSDIKVSVFDNTVEILSPGPLPNALTIEEILCGRSEIRNRAIARIFKEAKLIEQWGTGVRRIIEICTQSGLRRPEFIESGHFVIVRFFKGRRLNRNDKANDKGGRILKYISKNGGIGMAKAAELLELGKTRTYEIIRGLMDTGLITTQGEGRATRYVKVE